MLDLGAASHSAHEARILWPVHGPILCGSRKVWHSLPRPLGLDRTMSGGGMLVPDLDHARPVAHPTRHKGCPPRVRHPCSPCRLSRRKGPHPTPGPQPPRSGEAQRQAVSGCRRSDPRRHHRGLDPEGDQEHRAEIWLEDASPLEKVGSPVREEAAWLTRTAHAELFGVGHAAVNEHVKNIFESGEIEQAATISLMDMIRSDADPSKEGRKP